MQNILKKNNDNIYTEIYNKMISAKTTTSIKKQWLIIAYKFLGWTQCYHTMDWLVLIRMETDGLTGVSDNLEHTNLPFTQVPCTQ